MKTEAKWEEEQFLEKLKEKDRKAVSAFIHEYQANIYRVCFGFVHSREDAEELTQDVFMEIFKNIGSFKGESQLNTWIYRICYTRSLNRIRKNRWRQWVRSFDALLDGSFRNIPEDEVQPSQVEEEELTQLRKAISRLADMQKTAFVLHFYQGLKYQEIAEVMNTSVSSVESLIFRARKNLKKELSNLMKKA